MDTPEQLPAVFTSRPACGFPSPADDHMDGRLDLPALLVRRPAATFFCRAQGDSMLGCGVHDGDLLVVDRSITPADGDVVVATIADGLVAKRLTKLADGWALASENPAYPPLTIDPDEGVQIWGVVTFAITELCPR